MNVYIVLGRRDYEGDTFLAAFSTEEKADAYREKYMKSRGKWLENVWYSTFDNLYVLKQVVDSEE